MGLLPTRSELGVVSRSIAPDPNLTLDADTGRSLMGRFGLANGFR
jgi:hypothetical protein